jgi:hypothetical protein
VVQVVEQVMTPGFFAGVVGYPPARVVEPYFENFQDEAEEYQ